MSVQSSGGMLWVVEQPTRPNAVINSGASTTFTIEVTAPANAQAGDNGPSIIPIITSTRSGMTFMGTEFDDLEVESIEDIIIRLVDSPLKLTTRNRKQNRNRNRKRRQWANAGRN